MKYQHLKPALAVCLILLSGAAYSVIGGKPRKMQTIPTGTWGGTSIRLEIDGSTATIEYDCANGTITGPLRLDRNGKFSLQGTHVREHGGPIRMNEERKGEPARFSGWTDGKKMTLTVTLANSNQDVGTFTLVHGQEGRIRKCR
ncbi:MAG: hypothetical protein JWM21_5 [Acidobacteria bacterium]|nr:hypothetical protein [Acidobacteriota bacterium]